MNALSSLLNSIFLFFGVADKVRKTYKVTKILYVKTRPFFKNRNFKRSNIITCLDFIFLSYCAEHYIYVGKM